MKKPISPKLNPDIFVQAAEMIDGSQLHYFACTQLSILGGALERKLFEELYDLEQYYTFLSEYMFYYHEEPTQEELKQIRVFALLFAAEVAKSKQ